MEHEHADQPHLVSYSTFVAVWLALVMLTALTVAVSGVNLHGLSVIAALLIAAVKSSLVLFIFMHLRYERSGVRGMALVAVVTLAILLSLTFSDIYFR